MSTLSNIAIFGNGQASSFLSAGFQSLGYQVSVFARNNKNNEYPIHEFDPGKDYNLIILAVSDSSIYELSNKLPATQRLLVHLSGTAPLNAIHPKHTRRGVLWPVMSINKDTKTPLKEIPFILQAANEISSSELQKNVNLFGLKHYWLDEEQRNKLHLTAVFTQNFSNYLYQVGYELLKSDGLEFDLVKPLLSESLNRITKEAPFNFQTGPAIRNDQSTIQQHLKMLNQHEKTIYELLTKSIQDKNEGKL